MDYTGFIGPAYDLRNTNYSCQTCVNWYPEVQELGTGRQAQVAQLVPRPGLVPVITGLAGISRGGYIATTGDLFWVFGPTLYRISGNNTNAGWSATVIGNIAADNKPVQFTNNLFYLFLVSAERIFTYEFSTGTLAEQTADGFGSGATSLDFIDERIAFTRPDTDEFFWTKLDQNSIIPIVEENSVASAEGRPDILVGLINSGLDLWLFGHNTTEIWGSVGQGNIIFARRTNLIVEYGCYSPYAIKRIGNTVAWLGRSERGGAQMMVANGYNPQRISTYPIEQQWQNFTPAQLEAATGYVMQEGGHMFYVLNIPGATETWVYDFTVSQQMGKPMWHTWTSRNASNIIGKHRGEGHAYAFGRHVTGDYAEGTLYVMDDNVHTDNNRAITIERTAPHISNSMKRIFFDEIQFDFLTGKTTSNTLDPQIMLQFSDDGGVTWSDERLLSAGVIGQYGLKVDAQRLGSARGRVFRIRMTDPIYWALSGVSIEIREGAH